MVKGIDIIELHRYIPQGIFKPQWLKEVTTNSDHYPDKEFFFSVLLSEWIIFALTEFMYLSSTIISYI